MATWKDIEEDAPQLARRVRNRFDAGTNKTIATLRADGAPRISAIELKFDNAEITFGMMGGSAKLADIRRDPRIAVHCPTIEPPRTRQAGPVTPSWPAPRPKPARSKSQIMEPPSGSTSPRWSSPTSGHQQTT